LSLLLLANISKFMHREASEPTDAASAPMQYLGRQPMNLEPPHPTAGSSGELPWYVYDRHASLLHVARTLADAEAWAAQHWGVVEVASREEVAEHDYWYLLLASPGESSYQSRDYQARILRQERVVAIGRDPKAPPEYP